jgi:hypothetical protein
MLRNIILIFYEKSSFLHKILQKNALDSKVKTCKKSKHGGVL